MADHKQGKYAGHGKIGKMPVDQPTQPTENDRGFYWYDNGSGKITFAAAKDLSEALQWDIKRMAEINGYEAVFNIENLGRSARGADYANGYRVPSQPTLQFTVELRRRSQ